MTDIPFFWIALAIVSVILVARWWRPGSRLRSKTVGRGIDVEGDLLHACLGDKAMAERLIRHESERKPELSRTGAALMALSRLRDDAR